MCYLVQLKEPTKDVMMVVWMDERLVVCSVDRLVGVWVDLMVEYLAKR